MSWKREKYWLSAKGEGRKCMFVFIILAMGFLTVTFICSRIVRKSKWEKRLEDAEQEAYLAEYRKTHKKS